MNPIRVVLADDHKLLRTGVRKLIEEHPGISVVGEAGSCAEAIEKVKALHPDVVLMDINMPVEGGIGTTRDIKELAPETEVVILTMYGSDEHLFQAIRAGASGYLMKDVSDTDLVNTIRQVARGEAAIDPQMTRRLLNKFASLMDAKEIQGQATARAELSEREVEILTMIANGETNRTIAEKLFLSEKTVRHYASKVYRKLNVDHRTQAVVKAVELGLINPVREAGNK